jgi:hypothetical protein
LVAGSGVARAEDEGGIAVVAGLDFGFKAFKLLVPDGNSFNASYVDINPTLALGYGRFYANFSYDKTIDANSRITSDGNTAPTASADQLDFSRSDTTVTLGFRLTPSLNAFAGYTKGKNRFLETRVDVDPVNGSTLAISDIRYNSDGPFIGTSYTRSYGEKGSLSLSLAYGWLQGELRIKEYGGGNPPSSGAITGDTQGVSVGATWTGPLTGNLSYRYGLKWTQYKLTGGGDFDLTERYTTLFFGISNYF